VNAVPANFSVLYGRFCYGKLVAKFGSSFIKERDVNRSIFVLASLLWLSVQSTGYSQWGDQQHNPYRVQFGVSIMDRPGDLNNTTPVLLSLANGDTLLTGEQLSDPGTGAGPDLSIEYFPNASTLHYEFRGRYYGWRDQTSDTGTMQLTGATGLNFSRFETDYSSDYVSLEFNAKRTLRPGLNVLGGARFISMEEQLRMFGNGTVALPFPFGTVPFEQDIRVRATNPMLGLQTGLDWGWQLGNRVEVTSFLRAGGYANFAKQRTRIVNDLLGTDTTTVSDGSQLSFAGETGVKVNFEIFERHLYGFVGGEAHFLDRIATSPAQLELSGVGFNGLNTVAPRFYGITFGLDARF
jgi:hypothetical protein